MNATDEAGAGADAAGGARGGTRGDVGGGVSGGAETVASGGAAGGARGGAGGGAAAPGGGGGGASGGMGSAAGGDVASGARGGARGDVGSSGDGPSIAAAVVRRNLRRARALVVLGSAVLVVAIVATWVRAQILDTNGWTATSVQLLENDRVREYLASDLSERLLTVVDVQNLATSNLPRQLAPLAPALATAAAQVVPKAIERALQVPAVQVLWSHANRLAHERVIEVLNGGGRTLSTSGGAVTLNLETLLDRIGAQLGVGSNVGAKLPADKRRLVLMRSSQLRAAQDIVKGLRDLSFILPALVVLLYLGALYLSAGARRQALLDIGLGIIAGALLALLLRRWVESYVVNTLVTDEGARPALREVLSIATAGWRSRALWLLVTGVLFIFAGTLAGPMRWARSVRRLIATPLEHHPGWFIAGVLALVVLIAALGPERTPGQALPLLVELALAVVGVLALRRQVAREQRARVGGGPRDARP